MCSNDTLVSSRLNSVRIIYGTGPVNFRGIVSNWPLALRIHTDMPKRLRSLGRAAQKGSLESIHHVTRLL